MSHIDQVSCCCLISLAVQPSNNDMCLFLIPSIFLSQPTLTLYKIMVLVLVDLGRRLLYVSKDPRQLCLTMMLSIHDALHFKQYTIVHTSPKKPEEETEWALNVMVQLCFFFHSGLPLAFFSSPPFLFHAKSTFILHGLSVLFR